MGLDQQSTAEELLEIQADDLVFDFKDGEDAQLNGAKNALAPVTLNYLSERGLSSMIRKRDSIDLETCMSALYDFDFGERKNRLLKTEGQRRLLPPEVTAIGEQVNRDLVRLRKMMLQRAADIIRSNGS